MCGKQLLGWSGVPSPVSDLSGEDREVSLAVLRNLTVHTQRLRTEATACLFGLYQGHTQCVGIRSDYTWTWIQLALQRNGFREPMLITSKAVVGCKQTTGGGLDSLGACGCVTPKGCDSSGHMFRVTLLMSPSLNTLITAKVDRQTHPWTKDSDNRLSSRGERQKADHSLSGHCPSAPQICGTLGFTHRA